MYRKYYSYNDMPKPIKPTSNIPLSTQLPAQTSACENSLAKKSCENKKKSNLLSSFENDDLILIAVLVILLLDDCDDKLLLAAIGILLLGGF